jgi:hypothetical protein
MQFFPIPWETPLSIVFLLLIKMDKISVNINKGYPA